MASASVIPAGKVKNAHCGMMNARCQIVMDMDIALVVNVPVYVAIRAHSVKKVSENPECDAKRNVTDLIIIRKICKIVFFTFFILYEPIVPYSMKRRGKLNIPYVHRK
jgi:hypothetical protein